MFARVCACVPAAAAGQERAHKFEPEEKVNGEKTDEVRESPFLGARNFLKCKRDQFTKTGSGQTQEQLRKKGFSAGLLLPTSRSMLGDGCEGRRSGERSPK